MTGTVLFAVSLAVIVAVVVLAEPVLRHLVSRRLLHVLQQVVAVPDGADVTMPPGRVAPGLLRRHLAAATVTAPRMVVGDLEVHRVEVSLADVVVDTRLQVVAGSGVLVGRVPGDEVRRRAGAPDRVRLEDDRAAIALHGLSIRLRPVVSGQRIRLAPTPFSIAVPPLPEGASLVDVGTADDCLLVQVDIDLPRFLAPEN